MRTALCLSGLVGGFRETYESIKKFWVDPYGSDVFIHTYTHVVGKDWEQQCPDEYFDELSEMYHPASMVVDFWPDKKPMFQTDRFERNRSQTTWVDRCLSMWYKWRECNCLKENYEKQHGFKYDMVIRCRFDTLFESVDSSVRAELEEHSLLIPKRDAWGNVSGDTPPWKLYGGLMDQFAIGTSETIDIYTAMYDCVDDYFREGQRFNPEEMLWHHVIDKRRLIHKRILVNYHFVPWGWEHIGYGL